jgi:ribosomal protein S6
METKLNLNLGEKLYHLCVLIKEDKALESLVAHLKSYQINIKKEENLGKRELVFPINKSSELILASVFFTSPAIEVKKIEKDLKHEEYIERFLLTDWRGDPDAPARKERPRVGAHKEETR